MKKHVMTKCTYKDIVLDRQIVSSVSTKNRNNRFSYTMIHISIIEFIFKYLT